MAKEANVYRKEKMLLKVLGCTSILDELLPLHKSRNHLAVISLPGSNLRAQTQKRADDILVRSSLLTIAPP